MRENVKVKMFDLAPQMDKLFTRSVGRVDRQVADLKPKVLRGGNCYNAHLRLNTQTQKNGFCTRSAQLFQGSTGHRQLSDLNLEMLKFSMKHPKSPNLKS